MNNFIYSLYHIMVSFLQVSEYIIFSFLRWGYKHYFLHCRSLTVKLDPIPYLLSL